MAKLIVYNKRWFISEDGKTVLSGVGEPTGALAIAKEFDVIVTEFKDLSNKRAA